MVGKLLTRLVAAVIVLSLYVMPAQAATYQISQLTSNSVYEDRPQVSGGNVVWHGRDNNNYLEIFLYDGVTTTQLTNNGLHDWLPQISGDNIVWYGDDGNDREIFLYDGVTTTQLTDNAFDDWLPQISGDNVVWHGYDGNDWEIFLATPIVPEPSTYAMAAFGLIGLALYG